MGREFSAPRPPLMRQQHFCEKVVETAQEAAEAPKDEFYTPLARVSRFDGVRAWDKDLSMYAKAASPCAYNPK